MTDYTELVKALRVCGSIRYGIRCICCPYNGNGCYEKLCTDAAAAIEDLQKGLTTLQKCYEIADTTVDEVLKQLPKRGEWVHGREIGKEWVYDHWVTYFEDWRCSNCGVVFEQESKPQYHYCPNCGAKMEV